MSHTSSNKRFIWPLTLCLAVGRC